MEPKWTRERGFKLRTAVRRLGLTVVLKVWWGKRNEAGHYSGLDTTLGFLGLGSLLPAANEVRLTYPGGLACPQCWGQASPGIYPSQTHNKTQCFQWFFNTFMNKNNKLYRFQAFRDALRICNLGTTYRTSNCPNHPARNFGYCCLFGILSGNFLASLNWGSI